METVRLSADFDFVIPPTVRESLSLCPGQDVRLIPYDNRIELIPLKPMNALRGFLKGIDTTIEREPDRL